MRIPANNQWTQTNRSDVFGSLRGSFNIDLNTNLGRLRSTRLLQTTSQGGIHSVTTDSSMTSYPVNFKYFAPESVIWTVAGSVAHKTTSGFPYAPFAVDATTGTPVDCDSTLSDIDLGYINGNLYLVALANSKLYIKLSGGNWSSTAFTGAGPWNTCFYAGRLYIADGGANARNVKSTSDGTTIVAPTNTYALQLALDFVSTCIRASSNRIWIATKNQVPGLKGQVIEWDGAATQATRTYALDSNGALAMLIKDDVPWIVDAEGKLLVYSSGSFKEVARFPFNGKIPKNSTNNVNNRWIHPNGMMLLDGKINILINNEINDSTSSIEEFCPSGLWEYDENVGLYHKSSLSFTPVGTTTVYDYGQIRISGAGALCDMKIPSTASTATGRFLAGAVVYSDATTTDGAVFTNDTFTGATTSTQRGISIVTSKIYSANVSDTWQKIYAFHKKLTSSGNKLVLKYRTSTQDASEETITWTSTTTFTYTASSISYAVGDEVEMTQGVGGGLCAHITDIHFTGSTTVQVTIDETFTNATGTAKARFQKWIKLLPTQTSTTSTSLENAIGKPSTWIQFKIFGLFRAQDELEALELVNKVNQPNA